MTELPPDYPFGELPYESVLAPYTFTRGVWGIKSTIGAYIQSSLPAAIDAARVQWGATQYELPYPQAYHFYQPLEDNASPTVSVVVSDDSDWVRTDYDDAMGVSYESVRYNVHILIKVFSPKSAQGTLLNPPLQATARLCDDLTTLVRGLILLNPDFGTASDDSPLNYRIDEDMLTTDYAPTISAGQSRSDYVTTGTISFPLLSRETIPFAPYGPVESTIVETGLLPPPAQELLSGLYEFGLEQE